MSKEINISLHRQIIVRAQQLPVGSNRRIEIISRSIQGIIRAKSSDYKNND